MEHNQVIVIHGPGFRTAWILKKRLHGPSLEQFVTDYGPYVCGYTKPNYPVPAIPSDTTYLPLFDNFGGKVWLWIELWHFGKCIGKLDL